jgi:hypothetical protein
MTSTTVRSAQAFITEMGTHMIDVRSIASLRVAVASTPSNQFKRRLLTSSLFTCFDAAALQIVGPSIYRVSSNSAAMQAGFAVLVIGMLASLGRMWFLTIRDSNN